MYMRSSICGPVLAFGAAGAGMDFEIGVVAVGLAGEQRSRPGGARVLGLSCRDRRLGLGDDAVVALGLAQLDQLDIVVELALDAS